MSVRIAVRTYSHLINTGASLLSPPSSVGSGNCAISSLGTAGGDGGGGGEAPPCQHPVPSAAAIITDSTFSFILAM